MYLGSPCGNPCYMDIQFSPDPGSPLLKLSLSALSVTANYINPFLDSQIIRPPKEPCEFILRCKQQNPTSRDKFIERHFK